MNGSFPMFSQRVFSRHSWYMAKTGAAIVLAALLPGQRKPLSVRYNGAVAVWVPECVVCADLQCPQPTVEPSALRLFTYSSD